MIFGWVKKPFLNVFLFHGDLKGCDLCKTGYYYSWCRVCIIHMQPDTLDLFYVCADNSSHLHHVDRLALFQRCEVSELT